jgi:hypothetical protein
MSRLALIIILILWGFVADAQTKDSAQKTSWNGPHHTCGLGLEVYKFPDWKNVRRNWLTLQYSYYTGRRWSIHVKTSTFNYYDDAIASNSVVTGNDVAKYILDFNALAGFDISRCQTTRLLVVAGPTVRHIESYYERTIFFYPPYKHSQADGIDRWEAGFSGGLMYNWQPLRHFLIQPNATYSLYRSEKASVVRVGVMASFVF